MDARDVAITFINKVPQSIPSRHYILQTEWRIDEVSICVLNSNESKYWAGRVTHSELNCVAFELEIIYTKFYDEIKEALTRNGGVPNFQYLMEENKFILMNTEYFETKYLEVNMQQCYDLQRSVNMSAVDLIAGLRSELATAEEESSNLKQKYETMVRTLDKYLEEKTSIEKKLMRKFSVLLNSKKDKIAELQELLAEKKQKLKDATRFHIPEPSKRKSAENIGDGDADAAVKKPQPATQPVVVKLPKRRKLNTDGKPANKPEPKPASKTDPKPTTSPEAKMPSKKNSKSTLKTNDKPPVKTYTKGPNKTDDKPPIKTYSKLAIKMDTKSPTKTIAATKTAADTTTKSPTHTATKPSTAVRDANDSEADVVPLEILPADESNIMRESPDIFGDI